MLKKESKKKIENTELPYVVHLWGIEVNKKMPNEGFMPATEFQWEFYGPPQEDKRARWGIHVKSQCFYDNDMNSLPILSIGFMDGLALYEAKCYARDSFCPAVLNQTFDNAQYLLDGCFYVEVGVDRPKFGFLRAQEKSGSGIKIPCWLGRKNQVIAKALCTDYERGVAYLNKTEEIYPNLRGHFSVDDSEIIPVGCGWEIIDIDDFDEIIYFQSSAEKALFAVGYCDEEKYPSGKVIERLKNIICDTGQAWEQCCDGEQLSLF